MNESDDDDDGENPRKIEQANLNIVHPCPKLNRLAYDGRFSDKGLDRVGTPKRVGIRCGVGGKTSA